MMSPPLVAYSGLLRRYYVFSQAVMLETIGFSRVERGDK
jgi:hypothetical protein